LSLHQNIWELRSTLLHRQKRRAQVIKRSLEGNNIKTVLDLGCSEGYATSFISEISPLVVGVEINLDTLRIARKKIKKALFINASAEHLPFREDCFDAICILEVLEHLPDKLQKDSLNEADRVLRCNGVLLISSPNKEQITYTRCINCEKLTPLWGHLHSLDENKITSLLPANFQLIEQKHLPNLGLISCSNLFEPLPLAVWIMINNSLGLIKKGYWLVLKYVKVDARKGS
jgi:ubiquinone/menaquinone biosynthesis C-methylase UbiE